MFGLVEVWAKVWAKVWAATSREAPFLRSSIDWTFPVGRGMPLTF